MSASASVTDETSSATIRRSRGLSMSAVPHHAGIVDQLAHNQLELRGRARILELVSRIEGLAGIRNRHLLRHNERPTADRQHLAQRDQRLHAARAAGRGCAERKGAVLERVELRLVALAYNRYPVDRVLQERRDRRVVFRARNEDAAMVADKLLEPDGVWRQLRLGEVGVIDRQRIVGERDAGDVGIRERKLLGGERGKLNIERAGTQRARDDQNFWGGHSKPNKT